MYSIQEVEFGPYTKIEIVNEGVGEMVSFVPEYGATVLDLVLNDGKDNIPVISGHSTYEELLADKTFAGAVLAPWPNRVANAVYKFNGKTYVLPINEKERKNALHGLVYNKDFMVVEKDISNNMASVIMHYRYEGEHEGYPFDFLLEVGYNLSDEGFEVEISVENTFAAKSPMGLGFHPYLNLGTKSIDQLELTLPAVEKYELTEQMVPKGDPVPFTDFENPKKLKGYKFDDAFRMTDEISREYSIFLNDPKTNRELEIWIEGDKDMSSYLQLYIPPDRQSIAIEPMTCNVNAFNNKQGLQVLETDDVLELNYGIRFTN